MTGSSQDSLGGLNESGVGPPRTLGCHRLFKGSWQDPAWHDETFAAPRFKQLLAELDAEYDRLICMLHSEPQPLEASMNSHSLSGPFHLEGQQNERDSVMDSDMCMSEPDCSPPSRPVREGPLVPWHSRTQADSVGEETSCPKANEEDSPNVRPPSKAAASGKFTRSTSRAVSGEVSLGDASPRSATFRSSAESPPSRSPSRHSKALRHSSLQLNGSRLDLSVVLDMIHKRVEKTEERGRSFFRNRCSQYLNARNLEALVMSLILLNTGAMALELQYKGAEVAERAGILKPQQPVGELYPFAKDLFLGVEFFFTTAFAIEIIVRMAISEERCWRFFAAPLNWLDICVVVAGFLQVIYEVGQDYVDTDFLRLVRVAKLFRGIRLIEFGQVMSSVHLITKSIKASFSVMGWSLVLLLLIQCIAAMVICSVVHIQIDDPGKSAENRKVVYDYYGTFTRSVITMFEVTLGNWGPPCRVLMDNLGEAYASFFLVYRCFVGFAILNVITAVFVQQTTKCAHADQEVMLMAQQKEKQAYLAKLKQFFDAVDTSGDGFISMEEFEEMLSRPEIELWLSTLEVTLTDVQTLFQFLDYGGDGQISIDEFIFGISRLRGAARSVDVVEVLMHLSRLEELVRDDIGRRNYRPARVLSFQAVGDSGLRPRHTTRLGNIANNGFE